MLERNTAHGAPHGFVEVTRMSPQHPDHAWHSPVDRTFPHHAAHHQNVLKPLKALASPAASEKLFEKVAKSGASKTEFVML
jgi:hypothetical protein